MWPRDLNLAVSYCRQHFQNKTWLLFDVRVTFGRKLGKFWQLLFLGSVWADFPYTIPKSKPYDTVKHCSKFTFTMIGIVVFCNSNNLFQDTGVSEENCCFYIMLITLHCFNSSSRAILVSFSSFIEKLLLESLAAQFFDDWNVNNGYFYLPSQW